MGTRYPTCVGDARANNEWRYSNKSPLEIAAHDVLLMTIELILLNEYLYGDRDRMYDCERCAEYIEEGYGHSCEECFHDLETYELEKEKEKDREFDSFDFLQERLEGVR